MFAFIQAEITYRAGRVLTSSPEESNAPGGLAVELQEFSIRLNGLGHKYYLFPDLPVMQENPPAGMQKSGRHLPTAFVIPPNPRDCPHLLVRTYPGRLPCAGVRDVF